jgi:hypothetical protein
MANGGGTLEEHSPHQLLHRQSIEESVYEKKYFHHCIYAGINSSTLTYYGTRKLRP